ncbi:MAG: cadherin domain-containing protein [Xanthobacteraceae bacterium]|nr:cadherin domain-containing protein [Xanthobacteraceae bacterium]
MYGSETSGIQANLAVGTVTGGGGNDSLLSVEAIRGTELADIYNASGFSASSPNAGSAGTNQAGAAFNEFEGLGGDDVVTGNGNTRLAFYNASAGVTVDVAGGTASGNASVGNDTFTGVNAVSGSFFDDILRGSATTGTNSETFDGRGGNDLIDGRGGFDQVVYNNDASITSGISVDMAAGTVMGAGVGTDTLIAVESVRGTGFADTYVATGFSGASTDTGLAATFNEFEGLGGDDVVTGNGSTRITFVSASGGVTVDLAAGTASGNASVGNDTFTGVSRVRGSNSNDLISGDAGANTLEGQGGNDTLDGRGGSDILAGGGGADTFVYGFGSGADTITDFNRTQGDKIDLTGVPGIYGLGDVLALASLSGGVHTFINFGGGDTLFLSNVTPASLFATDFIFAPNLPPSGITLTGQAIAENSASGAVVGMLHAVDPNPGDSATFNLVDDAGGLFAIDGANLVAAGPLDFEAEASHQVTVRVTDSVGNSYDETFTIGVTDQNEAPTDISLSNSEVAENAGSGAVVGALSALDPDAGDSATFTLLDNAGGRFAIDGTNLVVSGALDHGTAPSHEITVRVTDSGGMTHDETFTITVTDQNAPPTDLLLSNASVAENSTAGTVVGTLSAVDPDAGDSASFTLPDGAGGLFAIDGANLVVAGPLDFETGASHQVTVRVTDSVGNTHDETFAVAVTDQNESPTDLLLSNASVGENSATGTVVGTLSAVDPDAGDSASFTLPDSAGGLFAIDGANLVTTGSLDFEAAASHQVTVRVTDGGGNTHDETFAVAVTDQNEAPADLLLTNASIAENSATGTVVGTLSAVDPDAGDSASFTLLDSAGGLFAIDGANLVVAGSLDFEAAASHPVTVRVTDGGGNTHDETFTITVTDEAGLTVAGDGDGNSLVGTSEDDTLQGLGGDDNLQGLAGNDVLDGGDGFDRANYTDAAEAVSIDLAGGTAAGAGVGLDTLISIEMVRGSEFADTYNAAGFGATSLNAGSVSSQNLDGRFNEFEGGGGDDVITGNGATRISYLSATVGVVVNLGLGTATGDASVGSDAFTGVASVRGSLFADTLTGGNGFENFEGRGGDDTINGGGGFDRAVYTFEAGGITVNLAAGTVTGGGGNDALASVEGIRGTAFADSYTATGFTTSSPNAGSAGALPSGAAFNEVEGMGGDDTITGNGNTRIVFYNAAAGVTVDIADGTAIGDASVGRDIFSGVSAIAGSAFDDVLRGSANGTSVVEFFDGRGGNDLIDGRGGFDVALYNNDGSITSGITVDMAAGSVTGLGTGTDTLIAIESVRGTNFADTYVATGFAGASADTGLPASFNEFEGLGGDDVITGNGNTRLTFVSATGGVTADIAAGTASGNASVGSDTFMGVSRIRGSNFDDTIAGGAGNNVLEGQGGNDILIGRGGADTLTGGAGTDTFVFLATGDSPGGGTSDTLTDFAVGVDKLDFAAIDANTATGGDDAFLFGGQTTAVQANSITWSQDGTNTIVRADVDGDAVADMTLTLSGLKALAANDFLL